MKGRSVAVGSIVMAAMAAIATGALGPVYGGHVTVELAELPARFEPAPAPGAGSRLIAALVHERLIDLGDLIPRPALAQSWTAAASGREWTLRLRPSAVFHDGTPIGSADVVRSLRRMGGHVTNAARSLGLERSHLYKKCRQLGIDVREEG